MKIVKSILVILALVVAGILIGALVRKVKHSEKSLAAPVLSTDSSKVEKTTPVLYVCPLHPQEVKKEQGHCSICGARLEIRV